MASYIIYITAFILSLITSTFGSPIDSSNTKDLGSGSGTVTFTNTCPFALWYQLVPPGNGNPAHDNPPWQILSSYSNALVNFGDGQGQSFKAALTNLDNSPTSANIDQIEFAWNQTMSMVFYDLSFIDGDILGASNIVSVTPSGGISAAFPTCQQLTCSDTGTCVDAFSTPMPDKTMACADTTDIVTVFCG